MKIYFAGSIRGGRADRDLYLQMIEHLARHGKVLTEHIGDSSLSEHGESSGDVFIYERDLSWIEEADVIVAEVTTPSLGVGYELGKAEALLKPVLCLYRKGGSNSLSAMVSGNSYFEVVEYESLEEATGLMDNYFSIFKQV